MADISFYKYLEAAFRHKLFKDTKATSFNFLGFNLPYESLEGKKGIFEYARRVLPSFYSLHFADTEEGHLQMAKDFLQKLDRHQDPDLPKYFDPNQAPAEYEGIITEAQQQSQAEGGPLPAQGAGAGMPGLPAGVSISPSPRRIYRIPPTPEAPKPDIAIASESGAIKEAGDSSKLVKASSSGAVQEAGQPSKLVTATSSGAVVEKPPSKILVADKGGLREHAIKPAGRFRFPAAFSNFGKNIGSKMGVFIKRNLTPMRLGTLVSGGIGAVAGSAFGPMGTLTGGIGGGLMPSWLRSGGGRRFFGKVGNGLVNTTARLANPAAKMSIPAPAKKYVLLFLGGFLLLVVGLALISPPSTQPDTIPPGGGTIPPVNLASCKFTRSGNSLPIKSSSLMSWISNAANQSGVPAAILASIAMHESTNFVANADNDHDAIKANQYCTKGNIFCEKNGRVLHSKVGKDDPCTPEEVAQGAKNAQAVGLMQHLDIYNSDKDLCSITESLNLAAKKLKANGIAAQPTKDQVTNAINRYYNSCTYDSYSYCEETWQDLQNCQATSAPGTNIFNCPVTGGKISYGSKESGTHCSPSYVRQYGSQGCNPQEAGYTGRDKAVDIVGTFPAVYLPTINGQKVTWKVAEASKTITDAEGGGQDFVATAIDGGKVYRIRFVHLESIPADLTLGSQAESDRKIGEYYKANPYGAHVHVTIQENGEFKPVDTYFNLCQ